MRLKVSIFILFFISNLSSGKSQNLVVDGSFELVEKCLSDFGNSVQYASYWYNPTNATPDFYNLCSTGNLNPYESWAGATRPYEGEGMLGLFLIKYMNKNNYHEYVSAELLKPLIKDSLYHISLAFKPAMLSELYTTRLAIGFSKDSIKVNQSKKILPEYQIMIEEYKEKREWFVFSSTYKAGGGERYVHLGNFLTNDFKAKPVGEIHEQLKNAAYYYFDALNIQADFQPFQEGDSLISNFLAVYFATDRYEIAKYYADDIINFLTDYEYGDYEFTITAYADHRGDADYNRKLARKRCMAVVNYFKLLKIPKSKVKMRVVGETEQFGVEKYKNRKVVIESIKKR